MAGDKKTRHKIRRKLESCSVLCDNIQQHLADCAAPFIDQDRPEEEAFVALGMFTEQLKEMFISLRAKL